MASIRERLQGDPNQEFDLLKTAAEKARLPFDRDLTLNLAFFLGRQYVQWDGVNSYAREAPRTSRSDNVRPIVNKIRHMVQEAHSKAISNRPTFDVLPATDDPSDISYAAVALAYLKWLADDAVGDYESELSEQVMWALAGAEGYMKWTYDPDLERPKFECVNPFELYVDPFAKKFSNARWVIHSQFLDVEQVEDIYGQRVQPTRMDRGDLERATLLRDMGYSPVLTGAVVNELWLKPGVSKKHSEGLFGAWTGKDQLIEPSKFPYNHGQIPFTQIGMIRLPSTSHFTSFVTDERKPQAELNKFHQQSVMIRENFANPKWWLPDELELQGDPDDSSNQILKGSGASGLKPEILQPASMAASDDGAWLREEMQDVAGLHEVSRAQVPGRVEAAKAIELLKESDDSRLAELLKRIRVQTSQGGWQCIMLADQFVSEKKIVTTYSAEGMPEVREFKMRGAKPGLRVVVTMGTGLSQSRAARVDAALNMWQQGIIQDPEVMAELLEIPVGTIAPQAAFDIKLARNENYTIARGTDEEGEPGTPIAPNSWDAHTIHIREHNNYRKTTDFLNLDPDVKKKFEFHVELHETMEINQLQKDAEKMMVSQGMAAADQTSQAAEGAAAGATTGPTGEAAAQPVASSNTPPQQSPNPSGRA